MNAKPTKSKSCYRLIYVNEFDKFDIRQAIVQAYSSSEAIERLRTLFAEDIYRVESTELLPEDAIVFGGFLFPNDGEL